MMPQDTGGATKASAEYDQTVTSDDTELETTRWPRLSKEESEAAREKWVYVFDMCVCA